MKKKSFDQTLFMCRINERRTELRITQVALCRHVGRDGSSYNAWVNGTEAVKIEYAVGMCEMLGLRPAWAMFDEGPKTNDEAKALGEVRQFIATLAPASGAAVQHGPLPPQFEWLRLTETEARDALTWLLTNAKSMPHERPLTIAVEKIATLLIGGIVPSELPQNRVQALEEVAIPSKASPNAKGEVQPRQLVSSSPSAPSSNKKSGKKS